MLYRFKGCGKCTGDLVLDGDEWHCVQCGRYYYPKRTEQLETPSDPPAVDPSSGEIAPRRRRGGRKKGVPHNVNARIGFQERREDIWWQANQKTIQYLDEGRVVKDIAELTGRNKREIYKVQRQLRAFRESELALS